MYYFISDTHLGQGADTLEREKRLCAWLRQIAPRAKAIYMLGDIFDFWFEYGKVVPRGFTRFLGTLSELSDAGVELHFFVGNHDQWAFDYLSKECGVKLHFKAQIVELYGKKILLAHGDNEPSKKPWLVKLMNRGFRSSLVQWCFAHLMHPNLALSLGDAWSSSSRKKKSIAHVFYGDDEPLVKYAKTLDEPDYFIFGHIHCAEEYALEGGRKIVFLGEWFEKYTYATLDESANLILKNL